MEKTALKTRIREYLRNTGKTFVEDGDTFLFKVNDEGMLPKEAEHLLESMFFILAGDRYVIDFTVGPILPPNDERTDDMLDLADLLTQTVMVSRVQYEEETGCLHADAIYDAFDGLPTDDGLELRIVDVLDDFTVCIAAVAGVLEGEDIEDAVDEAMDLIYPDDDADDGDGDEDTEDGDDEEGDGGDGDDDLPFGSVLKFPGSDE